VKLPVVVIVSSLAVASCAVNPAPQQPHDQASPITEQSIRGHMQFLAGDALNGRGSGTRDEWIAVTYAAALMQAWGLEPLGDNGGFVQQIEIERQEATAPPTLTFAGGRFTHGGDMRVQSLSAAHVSGGLQKFSAEVPVRPGAVLLMPAPPAADPRSGSRNTSGIALAAAILTLDSSGSGASGAHLPSLGGQLVGVTAAAPARPSSVALGKEAYAAISALADGTPIAIDAEVKTSTRTQTWNAVGRLRGSDPASVDQVILLSAHIDHLGSRPPREGAAASPDTIFNGADDDASGSVAVLELAHALALGPRPKRTIVFALFGSEEAGGYGSRYFADRPVVPLAQIVANLQFEMIGRPDAKVPPHTLWLTGYERSTLGPALAKQGALLVQDPHPEQSFFTRSDNIQFARRGVIAHTVSSYGLHKEYHQPSDEIGTIDFAHMTDAIRSMLAPVRWLADSGFKPEWLPGMSPATSGT
jgi:aminopeptidase YwaD